mgnify:CR=1 FL=1
MSEELNKEMEELEELEEVEEATAPSASNPSSVKLKQEKENMQKAKTSGKASDPKAAKGAVKPVTTVEDKDDEVEEGKTTKASVKKEFGHDKDDDDDEEEEEVKKEEKSTPKLKSEILQGIVDHIKGLKKEDLAKLYGTHVLGETEHEDDAEEEEEEDEKASKVKKESIDQTIEDLDVSQDIEALVGGEEELSDEFKTKAATIFETAIKSKVRTELEKIHAKNEESAKKVAEETMTSVVEKVDDYMNYVVEQWMSDNELAIERGLKGEIAEDFISGLKGLFEDHYIDVPDEKYDILEANLTKIEELEDKLNKQMEENVQLKKQKGELVKESMIADVADGMTDTETEKFQSLVDDVEFSDEESYKEKLQTIKESYFGSDEVKAQDETLTEEGTEETQEFSGDMAKYMSAIKKDNKREQK